MFCLYVLCKIKVLNNFELESTRLGISSEGETFSSIDFATGPSCPGQLLWRIVVEKSAITFLNHLIYELCGE